MLPYQEAGPGGEPELEGRGVIGGYIGEANIQYLILAMNFHPERKAGTGRADS